MIFPITDHFKIINYLVLAATLNKELAAMDGTQIFTTKEVRSKLETVKFNHLHSTPPPSNKCVPTTPTPIFDAGIF